jgi:GTPase SAR1 family protein
MSTTTTGGKIRYKLVFVGNQNVGKSSIIDKYINNRFDEASNVIFL